MLLQQDLLFLSPLSAADLEDHPKVLAEGGLVHVPRQVQSSPHEVGLALLLGCAGERFVGGSHQPFVGVGDHELHCVFPASVREVVG